MEQFDIKWDYTTKIVNSLMKISRVKEIVDLLELPVKLEEEIKKEVLIKRVHYSTKIEGNTLRLSEVKRIIEGNKTEHERNALEVKNYYNALTYLNKISEVSNAVNEDLILKLHNLVDGKAVSHKNSFRNGQNVIRDSKSGSIVYLPPEAKDINDLIKQMLKDFNEDNDIPIPIKAGILAYEFVTIHPFYDGNGRVSRLLATFVLKTYGYDLKGFYVMEEFYDKNINEYYNSLQMDLHHNFYFGRNAANITRWLEYFLDVMATTFEEVGNKVEELYKSSTMR